MARLFFIWSSAILLVFTIITSFFHPAFLLLLILVIPYIALGVHDMYFSTHNVLRNHPVIGHLRYLFEFIRPEIQQYFVQTNLSGRPFSRETRSLIYQRAKKVNDTQPFGTQRDINTNGYVHLFHSLTPKNPDRSCLRITIGESNCKQPYNSSRLNISAMSFGALGSTAVEAMNLGAKLGNFAQDTGEGGLTPYHLKHGGDIIWQLGTGYFGARTEEGNFDPAKFKEKALKDSVKMIEIKISQGAKPSHGGILPAAKVDAEIAKIRGVAMGKDCISPPQHTAFDTPVKLLEFVAQLRELSGGKPVGFKLCVGVKSEFLGICKAMLATNITPDFITVDGAEGGTGAAPLEFTNRLGMPINEAIAFVHNALVGIGMREKITIISSGKVTSGYDIIAKISLGADMCNAARAMMMAVGCIQSLKCNTNHCPTGVATQDPRRTRAIVPEEKSVHVKNFHHATLESALDLLGAMGHEHFNELDAQHIYMRKNPVHSLAFNQVIEYLKPQSLLDPDTVVDSWRQHWERASKDKF